MRSGYELLIRLSVPFSSASLFDPLPDTLAAVQSQTRNQNQEKGVELLESDDYRFGPITIHWVDLPMNNNLLKKPTGGKERERGRSAPRRGACGFLPYLSFMYAKF